MHTLNIIQRTLIATTSFTFFLFSLLISCQQSPAQAPDQNAPMTQSAKSFDPYQLSNIQGMWVWRASWIDTDQAQDQLLDFCQKYGFNRILMQIHPDNDAKTYTIRLPEELARLIREATKRGIAVEALDGAKDMALAENHEESLNKLDVLIDFNQSLPEGERFVAIHYDIEPYILQQWKAAGESRLVVMQDLLDYYTKARKKLDERGSKMMLAADIPMWYDAKTDPKDNCVLEFNGQTKNLHQHIQDICDYVGIMSYRTSALGPNSVSQHIESELAYAEKINKKVCCALETIELKDTPQITFYDSKPDALWKEVNLLQTKYKNRKGYAGILIHCYRGLRDLLPE